MPRKNIHEEPFDEGTITKLEIFQHYAREWLPTFVLSKKAKVYIFDFFAGTGYDKNYVPGSPIRILSEIKGQINHIIENSTSVYVILNEFDKKKYPQLVEACEKYLDDNPELKRSNIKVRYFNKDFEELYDAFEPHIGKAPSLVYLDQNGVRFIADKYFMSITSKPQTDFIYFVSSSYFIRFGDKPGFCDIVTPEGLKLIKEKPYKYIHTELLNYFKGKLPQDSPIRLYPFTIKKKGGVYGIIFGASHIRAADKFLRMAWQINSVNGAANFDIDDDSEKIQLVLWGPQPIKKVDAFKKTLHNKILTGEIKNNREAFEYAIDMGHIGTHAMEEIKEMKKTKLITYNASSPKVNYESAIGKNEIVVFQLVK